MKPPWPRALLGLTGKEALRLLKVLLSPATPRGRLGALLGDVGDVNMFQECRCSCSLLPLLRAREGLPGAW
jgi:hypothetical protein